MAHPFPRQNQNPLHLPLERQMRRIDFNRIRGLQKRTDRPLTVAFVAFGDLLRQLIERNVRAQAVEFQHPTLRADELIGDEKNLEFSIGEYDCPNITAFEDNSTIFANHPLLLDELRAHFRVGRKLAGKERNIRLLNFAGDIGAIEHDIAIVVKADLCFLDQGVNPVGVVAMMIAPADQQRKGAVHRAGIEMQKAKPLGDSLGRGAFARARGAVDGNDNSVFAQMMNEWIRRMDNEREGKSRSMNRAR